MANFARVDIDYRVDFKECAFYSNADTEPHTVFNKIEQYKVRCLFSNRTGEQFSAENLVESIARLNNMTTIEEMIPDIEKRRVFEEGSRDFDMDFPAEFPPEDVELHLGGKKMAVDRAKIKIHFHLSQKKQ